MKKIKMSNGMTLYYDLPAAFGSSWVMVTPWGNSCSAAAPPGVTCYIDETKQYVPSSDMTLSDIKDLLEAMS